MKPTLSMWGKLLLFTLAFGAIHKLLLLPANAYWHPPAGLRFVALVLLPPRLWVWPLAGEVLWSLQDAGNLARTGILGITLFAFIVHRLLATAGPLLLRRSAGPLLDGRPNTMLRLLLAMLLSALCCTLFNVWWLPQEYGGALAAMPRHLLFLQLLMGDFIGMLLIVPATLTLLRYRPGPEIRQCWKTDIPLVLVPTLALYAAVVLTAGSDIYFFATMLCILPVTYFAFRSGWRGVALAFPSASLVVAACTPVDGNFAQPIQAQLLLTVAGVTSLLLGASCDALRSSSEQLRRHNAQLLDANTRLDAASEELREAARRNLSLSEEVRRWITSELHDEIGQNLTALQTRLKLAERKTGASESFASVWDIIGGMRRSVSNLMGALRPAGLDEFGLAQALERGSIRDLVESNGLGYGIRIEAEPGLLDRLDNDTQTAIYRIVQEAATNTLRHANAQNFRAHLRVRPHGALQRITLLVNDDGNGSPARKPGKTGMGLQGIRDRVLSLGGKLRMRSDAKGTRMVLVIPSRS